MGKKGKKKEFKIEWSRYSSVSLTLVPLGHLKIFSFIVL